MPEYTPHPLCDVVPPLDGVEFYRLYTDIQKHGQHEPITVLGDKILDGRARYLVCKLLMVPCKVTYWAGGRDFNSLCDYIIKQHKENKKLSKSQRAMAASKMHELSKTYHENQRSHDMNVAQLKPKKEGIRMEHRGEKQMESLPFASIHYHARVLEIGPDYAREMLKFNRKNRNLNAKRIEALRRNIDRGYWQERNGQTIAFTTEGHLVDGQHRLNAIILSNKTVKVMVVFGCNCDAFKTVDIGQKRTMGQVLQMHGEKDTNNLAATVSRLHKILEHTSKFDRTQPLSPDEIMQSLEKRPEVRACAAYARKIYSDSHRVSASQLGVILYLFRNADSEKCMQFFELFRSGANMHERHPVLVLRNALDRIAQSPQKRTSEKVKLAYFIKAWNAFCHGRDLSRISWNSAKEKFPKITGLEIEIA